MTKTGDEDAAIAGDDSKTSPFASGAYRYYVLAVLTIVYVFNFVDRQLLVILQEPIKEELGLSDSQLVLLTGFAFALFYVACGLPIARWADNGVRRNIIALALTVWSVMTALSGLAGNYAHLLLARIGVGVGEAGGSPPAHSMISDIFSKKSRALALSVYSIGIYIGILIGFALGGWIADTFNWRIAFFIVGLPGILLAILVRVTVKEPQRGWSEGKTSSVAAAPPLGEVLRHLWTRPSFRFIALGASLQAFIIYGVGNWLPSYFQRSFEISLTEVGAWMAITSGFGGGAGSFFGGWISDKLGARDIRWYLWAPAILVALVAPILLVALTTDMKYLALVLTGPFNFFTAAYLGAMLAISHNLVTFRMRALTSAILFFVLNLIGLGFGPLCVGILSDQLAAYGSESPLGTSMLIFGAIAAIGAAGMYALAARTVRQDIMTSDSERRAEV